MATEAAFRKEKTGYGGLRIFILLLIVMCTGMGVRVKQLQARAAELEQKRAEIQSQIDYQNEYKEYLAEYRKYTGTKKYVEETARERLGLVYSDEIVFRNKK